MKQASNEIVNAFTIDVEDWFQVAAFALYIDRKDWDSLECRVERNVNLLLQTLDKHDVKATFFTLGWIAERYPAMVRSIYENGHEIASHGYGHFRVSEMTQEQFKEDVQRAKNILENITGANIYGYRAPSFSINSSTPWAHKTLRETGHNYSSSVYPIKHDHYGSPTAPRYPYVDESGIVEIPPSTIQIGNRNLPAAGGGYFRLFPYFLSREAIRKINRSENKISNFYFHPWEVDPEQPKVKTADRLSRFRHYTNQKFMMKKLETLLQDFEWGPVNTVYSEILFRKDVARK